MANQLTELEVFEISLVDRGAIREVFTVIKSENNKDDLVNDYNSTAIVESISKMSNDEFISIMKNLMSRYEEINKGGKSMNEEIKKFVEDLFAGSMETVNKNFVSINKAIDNIQDSVSKVATASEEIKKAASAEKTEAEKKKEEELKMEADRKKAEEAKLSEVSKTVTSMVESLQKFETTISELQSTKDAVEKRLVEVEKQENTSNQLKDDVAKDAAKVPFWKSVIGTPGV